MITRQGKVKFDEGEELS
ncbi:hypothetical protein [Halobacillus kuroshimensis]